MAIPTFRYSFAKAFDKLTVEQGKEARQQIFEYLGCNFGSDYSRRKHNFRNMPHHVYRTITDIFGQYGLNETDIWTIS